MPKYPRLDNYWSRSARISIPVKMYCQARDDLFKSYQAGDISRREFYQRMRTEARENIIGQKKLSRLLVSGLHIGNFIDYD